MKSFRLRLYISSKAFALLVLSIALVGGSACAQLQLIGIMHGTGALGPDGFYLQDWRGAGLRFAIRRYGQARNEAKRASEPSGRFH